MPNVVGTQNSYCPARGGWVATLVMYSDGSTRLFGDHARAVDSHRRFGAATVPESEIPELAPQPAMGQPLKRTGGRTRKNPR